MYKLLIVDDEEEVREGMRDFIPWHDLGFELTGAAENGSEALACLEERPVDVVICDINMPIMDGLELTEKMAASHPKTKVIILTGYDDFDYAQQAIKLNVYDFILKPLTPDEVKKLLVSLKNDLDRESQELKNIRKMKERLKESLPLLRERYLNRWVEGRLTEEEIAKKFVSMDIRLKGNSWAVLVLQMDRESNLECDEWQDDLFTFAVTNICEEWIERLLQGGHVFVNPMNQIVAVCASVHADMKQAQSQFMQAAEKIRASVENYIRETVTVGVGSAERLQTVPESYRNAQRALEYRFLYGTNRVVYIGDVEQDHQHREDANRIFALQERIVKYLKVSTQSEVEQLLRDFFSELDAAGLEPETYKIHVLELIILLSKTYSGFLACEGEQRNVLHPFFEVSRLTTVREVKDWVERWCVEIVRTIVGTREDYNEKKVEEAIRFIEEHFPEPDMSIQKVCQHLHMSVSHFSTIFKNVTGETFVEYITGLRMEKARVLLRTSAFKTYEIAEKVGFNNPHYFSVVFKKSVGVSPSEYRNQC